MLLLSHLSTKCQRNGSIWNIVPTEYITLSRLIFQWLARKFWCSSFKFYWLLFSQSIKIKAFTHLSNSEIKLLHSVLLQLIYILPETRNETSSHHEKKFSFCGGRNETAHYVTVILFDLRCFVLDDFTQLYLDLSHLRGQKFIYNFKKLFKCTL